MLLKNSLFKTPLNITPTGIFTTLLTSALLSAPFAANAQWWDEMDGYVGVGVGQSDLSPQHVKDQGFSIDDHAQLAWKLTGGVDVNDHISIEAYYSDLGSTDLSPDSEIGYHMAGADVMLHYWAKGEERLPGSIALYAKAGLNHTNTLSSGSVDENGDLRALFGGLGAEVYLPQKFSVRFEFESYNADASLLSLNLVKRFGFSSKRSKSNEFVAMIEQLPETAAGPKVAVLVPFVLDSDSDGLLDDEDQCLNTVKGATVNEFGCAVLNTDIAGHIANVQFESGSIALTDSSEASLSKVVDLLVSNDAVKVEVQAYTDSIGRGKANKALSQQRAESVVSYLKGNGISSDRLTASGYGEEKPVADNKTKAGRAKNRRVEFVLTTH